MISKFCYNYNFYEKNITTIKKLFELCKGDISQVNAISQFMLSQCWIYLDSVFKNDIGANYLNLGTKKFQRRSTMNDAII